ncbi:MAG: BatD family protein [Bacteroidales bacterium]|nr:BatD family protein [Bacteroidales bacterium]
MKKFLYTAALLFVTAVSSAQNTIKVQAPSVVGLEEQFNVTFVIAGEENPSNFSWTPPGDHFQLVWGPQRGTSSSVQIINGKRTSSRQTTYTYILMPKGTGSFQIPAATAYVGDEQISSSPFSIQVVTDASSSQGAQSSGSSSSGQSSSGSSSSSGSRQASSSGEIAAGDLFLRLSLSRSEVVIGEPITATLKLYQRVDIAGFENAKFPTFNGFWSQETYAPTNIEFKRESFDDKIYSSAVLRTYVLIPQQAGTITIDPAELVCLVNIRVGSGSSNSVFDSFFQDEYRTIRKRITTPAQKVRVNALPAGQPASFGGGVGNFGISARLTSDELKTHDAASLILTVSGRGNVALLEDPKVNFPPDFEVYDTKVSENTDKSTGGTSGSKTFEFPFIPRSAGEFTIEPVEYSYYDVNAGKYVTLRTEPMSLKVTKGKGSDASSAIISPGVERRDVKSLAGDIRFISTKKPAFRKEGSFFVLSPLFWLLTALLLLSALVAALVLRKAAAMKADVALTKNRKATKMARKRLKQAGEYLDKNLYTAFYEELHKALLGFTSDKLNMDMSELNKDNISAALTDGGVSEESAKAFTDLLDSCEFARYSPDAGHEAMQTHYDSAVKVISDIDSSYRTHSRTKGAGAALIALLLGTSLSLNALAQQNEGGLVLNVSDSSSSQSSYAPVIAPKEEAVPDISVEDFAGAPADSLWEAGVAAYSDGRYYEAAVLWQAVTLSGEESPVLYYNIGNAFFKQSNYPQAILYYERALKLDPSYSDARFNLEYANGFVQDKIEPVPEFILKSLARKLCYVLGSDAWAVLFLLFLAAALAMAVLFLLASTTGRRRAGFYTGIVFLLLSLASLGFSIWQKSDYRNAGDAIVTAPVSAVKSSPGDGSAKDLFVIHEGTKVKVLDQVGDWKNISLADGRQGWMMSKDIEVI